MLSSLNAPHSSIRYIENPSSVLCKILFYASTEKLQNQFYSFLSICCVHNTYMHMCTHDKTLQLYYKCECKRIKIKTFKINSVCVYIFNHSHACIRLHDALMSIETFFFIVFLVFLEYMDNVDTNIYWSLLVFCILIGILWSEIRLLDNHHQHHHDRKLNANKFWSKSFKLRTEALLLLHIMQICINKIKTCICTHKEMYGIGRCDTKKSSSKLLWVKHKWCALLSRRAIKCSKKNSKLNIVPLDAHHILAHILNK